MALSRKWSSAFLVAATVAAGLLSPLMDAAPRRASARADDALNAAFATVQARARTEDYQRGRFDPIHFKPAIDSARDEACLVCHKEIVTTRPRAESPAGVKASDTQSWYQTLDTYQGEQQTFHWRHLQSPYAKQVMNLSCNFCHQGVDPLHKTPSAPGNADARGAMQTSWPGGAPPFTLRKTVNPSETCLRCHGAYPAELMGLSGSWHDLRESMETPEQPNGCLTCHAEQFRTVRHQVSYLNADGIEKAAKDSSDVCYGCHGGRQWYRISYPYPRHPWPNMPADTPDWAKNRPATSESRFDLTTKK